MNVFVKAALSKVNDAVVQIDTILESVAEYLMRK